MNYRRTFSLFLFVVINSGFSINGLLSLLELKNGHGIIIHCACIINQQQREESKLRQNLLKQGETLNFLKYYQQSNKFQDEWPALVDKTGASLSTITALEHVQKLCLKMILRFGKRVAVQNSLPTWHRQITIDRCKNFYLIKYLMEIAEAVSEYFQFKIKNRRFLCGMGRTACKTTALGNNGCCVINWSYLFVLQRRRKWTRKAIEPSDRSNVSMIFRF